MIGLFEGVLGIWGFLLTLIAFGSGGMGALLSLVVAWAPLGLLLWFRRARAKSFEAVHAACLTQAGITPGAGFDHAEDGTGIAINREAKTLVFTTRGASKTYRYADVRAWDARKETSGKVVGHSMQAIGAAAAMDREAKLNTGLFVTVRDVDHPQWRVSMKIENVRLRWVEILRQEINEGGVANASAS